MKIVIEDVKVEKIVKVGDLIKYNNGDVVFMISEINYKYTWTSLNSGTIGKKLYDSIKDLMDNEFGNDNYHVYPSNNYSLKLIEN